MERGGGMHESVSGLAPDPMLKDRDALLDLESIRDRLALVMARSARLPIEACETARVNYQHGKSLRVLYRLRIDGKQEIIAARMFKEGRGADAFEAALVRAPLGNGIR